MQIHSVNDGLRARRKTYTHACGEDLGEAVEADNSANLGLIKFQPEVRRRSSAFSKVQIVVGIVYA